MKSNPVFTTRVIYFEVFIGSGGVCHCTMDSEETMYASNPVQFCAHTVFRAVLA